jgi:hypothetical protein
MYTNSKTEAYPTTSSADVKLWDFEGTSVELDGNALINNQAESTGQTRRL